MSSKCVKPSTIDLPAKRESCAIVDNKKKIPKRKVFNDMWLKNKLFKNWLRRSSNGDRAFCTSCRIEMTCKKSVLIKHAKSKSHVTDWRIKSPILPPAFNKNTQANINQKVKENMQVAEMELLAFVTLHNIPLSAVDDMVRLFNRISVMEGIPGKLVWPKKKNMTSL
ncbi:hypothetical protein PV326_008049 [Microctonus aethiopoides]|uniref:Uncharacterized protein n=1 Tax=Microctonus aethiopoides TaxID=144406 RepID=A0AA39C4G2_9HYME|nr:hypothetical protein PV326_008049 [Microctonus aethiopoides]KAK0157414.1 hypothetical protein PV328_011159 [Microctonus aethiopoides]